MTEIGKVSWSRFDLSWRNRDESSVLWYSSSTLPVLLLFSCTALSIVIRNLYAWSYTMEYIQNKRIYHMIKCMGGVWRARSNGLGGKCFHISCPGKPYPLLMPWKYDHATANNHRILQCCFICFQAHSEQRNLTFILFVHVLSINFVHLLACSCSILRVTRTIKQNNHI